MFFCTAAVIFYNEDDNDFFMKQRSFTCGRKSLQFGPIAMCSTHYFIIPQSVLTMAF